MTIDIIAKDYQLPTQEKPVRDETPRYLKTAFGDDPLRNTKPHQAQENYFSLDTAIPQKGYVSQISTYSRN